MKTEKRLISKKAISIEYGLNYSEINKICKKYKLKYEKSKINGRLVECYDQDVFSNILVNAGFIGLELKTGRVVWVKRVYPLFPRYDNQV